MKAAQTWVLIADGARARVVRRTLANMDAEDLLFRFDHKQLGEIMSDRPGRSFASTGTRRSAMEYRSEPEKDQESRFAEAIVAELERHLRGQEFERLAIVAEPRMLGLLRGKISHALRRSVVMEVAKDLTKVPRHELDAVITQLEL